MRACLHGEKPLILSILAQAAATTQHIRWTDLGLDPVLLSIQGHAILRWYSLAYIAGILIGWWYLLKLLEQPGAPMAKRHADDLVFYVTIGVILGGRIGYVLFYAPQMLLDPLQMLKLWDGGMSFHGGVIGTSLAMILLAKRKGLDWLRIHDYVACCVPFGLFFGRIANFINGELWGKPSDLPWAIIFPRTGDDIARHPSQLYEAGLEGIGLFLLLWWFFWKTKARTDPGKLTGIFLVGYGCVRFFIEFFREPDEQFSGTFLATTIHMGQILCIPMILGGIYLIVTSAGRRRRVEPIAGSESVA